MRKWYVPLALLGMSGVGALVLSDTGRRALRWVWDHAHEAPEALADFNERIEGELDRIQSSLNKLADSLETESTAG
jgi:hypothetical protein